jgi:beta-lactamase class A
MQEYLVGLIDHFAAQGRPGLHEQIAVNWVCYDQANLTAGSGLGAAWADQKPIYPASVVKLVYAVAVEAWLQKGLLLETVELRRAVDDMIGISSNDATGLVVDCLTGTSSGPDLQGEAWESWQRQRQLVNEWLSDFGWGELERVNCCQKTWGDGPYGREQRFYGENNINRNALTTASVSRLLEAVMTDGLLSPPACHRLRSALARSLDQGKREADPENQVDGFLGEGLPANSMLWSKAGWMSQARHDAAWWSEPEGTTQLLVVFSVGAERADDNQLLPGIARALSTFQA